MREQELRDLDVLVDSLAAGLGGEDVLKAAKHIIREVQARAPLEQVKKVVQCDADEDEEELEDNAEAKSLLYNGVLMLNEY